MLLTALELKLAPNSKDRRRGRRTCKCLSKKRVIKLAYNSSSFMSSTPLLPILTIGTPCFGGQVSWLYAVSLLKLQKTFTQARLEHQLPAAGW